MDAASTTSYATGHDSNNDISDRTAAARLFAEYAAKAPCNNFMFAVPQYTKIMTFDITYHCQDTVRAYDPECITQSFSRQGAGWCVGSGEHNTEVRTRYLRISSVSQSQEEPTSNDPSHVSSPRFCRDAASIFLHLSTPLATNSRLALATLQGRSFPRRGLARSRCRYRS